jgi:hypothetical protein
VSIFNESIAKLRVNLLLSLVEKECHESWDECKELARIKPIYAMDLDGLKKSKHGRRFRIYMYRSALVHLSASATRADDSIF